MVILHNKPCTWLAMWSSYHNPEQVCRIINSDLQETCASIDECASACCFFFRVDNVAVPIKLHEKTSVTKSVSFGMDFGFVQPQQIASWPSSGQLHLQGYCQKSALESESAKSSVTGRGIDRRHPQNISRRKTAPYIVLDPINVERDLKVDKGNILQDRSISGSRIQTKKTEHFQ
jgi:hypothetical protein